jgi:hypothetical protein
MSNLENFGNIYSNLSESAYNNRPKNFTANESSKKAKKFDFSENVTVTHTDKNGKVTKEKIYGGKNLPNNGKVYLQPDPTVKTIKEQPAFPLVNAPATINSYQKGLLTDKKAA